MWLFSLSDQNESFCCILSLSLFLALPPSLSLSHTHSLSHSLYSCLRYFLVYTILHQSQTWGVLHRIDHCVCLSLTQKATIAKLNVDPPSGYIQPLPRSYLRSTRYEPQDNLTKPPPLHRTYSNVNWARRNSICRSSFGSTCVLFLCATRLFLALNLIIWVYHHHSNDQRRLFPRKILPQHSGRLTDHSTTTTTTITTTTNTATLTLNHAPSFTSNSRGTLRLAGV